MPKTAPSPALPPVAAHRAARAWGLAVLALLLALAPAAAAFAADAVVLQLKWRHQFQFAGYYAALEQGYYKDAGLDVTIREGGPNVSALDEVAMGRADFGVGSSAALVRRSRGEDVVVLAAVFQHSPAILLVPQRGPRPPSLHELQGARLMDAPDSEDIDAMLLGQSVDYHRMPRVPHTGDPHLLIDGGADAMVGYSTNEPFILDRAGVGYAVFSPRDRGVDFYGDNLVTSQSLLARKPQQAAAFREASLKGWRYALMHQAEVVDLILRRWSQAKSRDALLFEARQTAPLIQGDLVDLGYQSPQRWQAIAVTYRELGVIDGATVPEGLVYDPDAGRMPAQVQRMLAAAVGLAAAALTVVGWIAILNRRLRGQVEQRERAEAEAARVTRQYLAMADSLPVAAYRARIHPDGTTTAPFIGAQAEGILGIPLDELRADPSCRYRNVVPEDAAIPRDRLMAAMSRVVAGEADVRLQIVVRLRFGGRIHWVQSIALADERFDDGSVSWNGYFEDITEAQTARTALLEERHRLQQTLDTAPMGVAIVVDRVARVANPRMRELVTLDGTPDTTVYVDPDTPWRIRAIVARDGEARDIEAQVRGPDGQVRDVLATYLPTVHEGRDATLAWLVDVTRLKATQKALELARQAAEDATRAKSQFLANMSHEIRTPMNAIIGMAHLALRSGLEPRQRDYVEKISQAARTLLSLIDDILDYSKVEAGRMELEAIDFGLDEVVRGVLNVTSHRAHDKGLELLVDVPADLPRTLRGDPLRLGQVLINLVGNAIKFTERGEVTLAIACADSAAAGSLDAGPVRLRFRVVDTGIGIDEDTVRRLFVAFHQADNSTTRRFGGTGLGLSICHRLVGLMGGTIDCRSTPGRGTTFEFEVAFEVAPGSPPVPASRREASHVSTPSRIEAALEGMPLDGVRVLVVDDNDVNRQIAGELLGAAGARVETANHGQDALDRLEAHGAGGFDVVLMDVQMPGMGGIEATRRIRADARFAALPVVAMTAHAMAEERERCLQAGMDDHVAKPIDPVRFLETVHHWAVQRSGARGGVSLSQVVEFPVASTGSSSSTVVAPSFAPPVESALRALGVLDVDAALARVLGRWPVYLNLLRRFCAEGTDPVEVARSARRAGLADDAVRAMHTLRGVAGTLGAGDLSRAAADAENALHAPDPAAAGASAAIDRVEAALRELVAAVEPLLPRREPEPGHAVAAEVDWAAARPVVEELRRLLANDDVRAASLVTRHAEVLRGALGPAFDAMARDVANYALQEGLAALDAARSGRPELV